MHIIATSCSTCHILPNMDCHIRKSPNSCSPLRHISVSYLRRLMVGFGRELARVMFSKSHLCGPKHFTLKIASSTNNAAVSWNSHTSIAFFSSMASAASPAPCLLRNRAQSRAIIPLLRPTLPFLAAICGGSSTSKVARRVLHRQQGTSSIELKYLLQPQRNEVRAHPEKLEISAIKWREQPLHMTNVNYKQQEFLATYLFLSSFSTRLQRTPRATTTISRSSSASQPFPFSLSEVVGSGAWWFFSFSFPSRNTWASEEGLGKWATNRAAIASRPPHIATWRQPTGLLFVRFIRT